MNFAIGFAIFLAIVVIIGLMIIGMYNGLVAARNQVKNAFSQMDVQMKMRGDLIPALVETVKGSSFNERGTLEAVIKARNQTLSATTPQEKMEANNQLSSALNRLMVLTEAYPQLQTNQNFMQLMGELKDVEEKIRYSRQFYNDTVQKYNTRIQSFPANILAGMFGFTAEPYFEISEAERVAPKVDFSSLNPTAGQVSVPSNPTTQDAVTSQSINNINTSNPTNPPQQ